MDVLNYTGFFHILINYFSQCEQENKVISKTRNETLKTIKAKQNKTKRM